MTLAQLISTIASAEIRSTVDGSGPASTEYGAEDQKSKQTGSMGTFLYKVYKKFVSEIDGSHCPMYPSCSRYGRDSIAKYGLKGIFMTADRLNRCGHDLKRYQVTAIGDNTHYLDEVQ